MTSSVTPPPPELLDRDGFDLPEVRETLERLQHTVLDERRRPLGLRLRQHLSDARLGLDEPLHLVAANQELVDGRAPPVAALGAGRAPLALVADEPHVVLAVELAAAVL